MTSMYLAGGPWYTSGTFYGAATLIATVVIGLATIFASLLAGSTKRMITYHLAEDSPLLTTAAVLPHADIKVIRDGKPLENPRLVAVRVESRGRRDIGSDEFDKGLPLTIDLGIEILKLISFEAVPAIGESDIAVGPTCLRIGPCAIRKRHVITFGLLADGEKPTLTHKGEPLNVTVRRGADGGRPPQTFWTRQTLAGVGGGAVLGAAAVLGGAAALGFAGAADVGATLAGTAGADAGLAELAVAAAVTTITAIATLLKRRRSRH